MPRCDKCRRLRVTVQCMSCSGNFCTGCIQIEEHACSSMDEKIKKELETLEKKCVKLKPPSFW